MAVSTINKGFTKDIGETEGVVCPNCKKAVRMRLFTTTDISIVSKLIRKDGNMDVAVCPQCATVFTIAENYMKEKTSGTTVFITENDLTVLVKGK